MNDILKELDLIDGLLEQKGFAPDSSARHHLSIARSLAASPTAAPGGEPAELNCVCGATWEDSGKGFELVASPSAPKEALDGARLDWLEQSDIGPEATHELIFDWRFKGKRYPGGLRDAIDEAMKQGSN